MIVEVEASVQFDVFTAGKAPAVPKESAEVLYHTCVCVKIVLEQTLLMSLIITAYEFVF